MKLKYFFLLLSLYFHLLPFAKEQLLNYPKLSDKASNPIDKIIIFQPDQAQIQINEDTVLPLNIIKNFTKYHDSYFINPNLFFMVDITNSSFALAESIYYKINLNNVGEIRDVERRIDSLTEVQYSNYIQAKFSSRGGMPTSTSEISSSIGENEVILYGKKGQKLYFLYTTEKVSYDISVGNLDDQISCKLANGAINVCAVSYQGKIMLKFFVLIYANSSSKKIIEKHSQDVDGFTNHENAILYDTENEDYKILCANKINDKSIECKQYILLRFITNKKKKNNLI